MSILNQLPFLYTGIELMVGLIPTISAGFQSGITPYTFCFPIGCFFNPRSICASITCNLFACLSLLSDLPQYEGRACATKDLHAHDFLWML